jgi:hypothetical protein
MKILTRLDRHDSQRLVTAIAQTALGSDEWHNALADLQNAIGVMYGGWASVYDWEDWDNYDLNTRSQVITEYMESELRAEGGTA